MALTGTELAYVQPPTPSVVAVSGDHLVTFDLGLSLADFEVVAQ